MSSRPKARTLPEPPFLVVSTGGTDAVGASRSLSSRPEARTQSGPEWRDLGGGGPRRPAAAESPPAVAVLLVVIKAAGAHHRVEVELPTEAFAHHPWEPEALFRELRELWLPEHVRQRRLAFTKAAELAGVPLALFLERMKALGITPFDLDPEEVALELR